MARTTCPTSAETSVWRARMNRPQNKEIKFEYPVSLGGKEVTSITMRRQKVRDAMDAEVMAENDTQAAREVALFAVLLGVPAANLMDMDMEDYQKLQEGYLFLTGNRPRISEKNSDSASSSSQDKPAGD
ncbi:MAG TPA: hypothetical protein DCS48_05835 [Desulfovibrio sp.]|nr:hypothetical protein [Desulfovibrio sp.]